MRVPINWLREYVDFDISAEEVADLLTMSGTETESIEVVGSDCEGVLVGEVTNVDPHPDADNLRVCELNMGGRNIQVVCGADNFSVGDKVPVIEAGGALPDGTAIGETEIRGVKSSGMICSERELSLSDEHTGIMVLPEDSMPGSPVADIVGPPETVLVLEVTWNRSDCLSMIGIAREVAALIGEKIKLPDVNFEETGSVIDEMIEVRIDAPEDCPRYTARALTGVDLAPSPMWMQRRLAACGIRAINNLVDITNYVMLESGHPLHAFDHSLLEGKKIIVRTGVQGSKMTTLDGVERTISSETLLIADESNPVAIAGVMGGAGSEIREETETVLLESASFNPVSIRRTSSELNLSTESAHRFERGVDPMNVEWASRRAAALMVSIAGATACKGVVDEFPGKVEDAVLSCSFAGTRSLLGIEISDDEIVSILNNLTIEVTETDGDTFTVKVPSFRRDITIEADIIEEIARSNGVDNIPTATPVARIVPGATDIKIRAVESCRDRMIGLGFAETMHYSFLSDKLVKLFKVIDEKDMVVLPNPVSTDHSIMRPSLLPQMVESMGRNLARQVSDLAFFEIGRVFVRSADGSVAEEDRLTLGIMGSTNSGISGGMDKPDPVALFLALKGALECLYAGQRVSGLEFLPCSGMPFEEGAAVDVVVSGEIQGKMGLLESGLRENWRMTDPVAVAEIKLSGLISNVFDVPELTTIPAYPSIARDVAILVSEDVTHEQVMKVIKAAAPKDLTAVNLFDIFKGKGVADSNKSLAYSLVYRSAEHTLTDEDANGYHEAIKAALVSELNAEIR